MGASRVACASFNLGTNTTITITRDNKAYTHTLKYSFNGASGTIATKTSQTSIVWTPPVSEFYSKIPNTTSGYGKITCETYSGNTLIGTTTAGFYAYAVKSACLPTVSGTVEDTNPATLALTGNKGHLVRFLSKPKCVLTATPKNSATIKTIQIENPLGLVATTSPYTFDTVYDQEFRFKATDSRGYTTTTKKYVEKIVDYVPCYFDKEPVITRTESTSTTATTSVSGYCFNGSFGAVSNTLTIQYRYKTSNGSYGSFHNVTPTWNTDGTFTADITISNLSLGETYSVEFVASDKLTSFPVEAVLGQSTGDLRIAKDYIQTKNDIIIGDSNNDIWKGVRARRKVGNVSYSAKFGVGDSPSAKIELFNDDSNKSLGEIEIRSDGKLYNNLNGLSLAEISCASPSMGGSGNSGYLYLEGGNMLPILIQWGRMNIVPAGANVITALDIGFIWEFGSIPALFTSQNNNIVALVETSPGDIKSTGFTMYIRRPNTANTGTWWLAIGNGKNSIPL